MRETMVFLVSLDTSKGPVHGFCGMWGVLAAAFFDWGKAGRQGQRMVHFVQFLRLKYNLKHSLIGG